MVAPYAVASLPSRSRPVASHHVPTLRFRLPRKRDVAYVKSAPPSQLPVRPTGSPTVAIAPIHDSDQRLRLTRPTAIPAASSTIPGFERVAVAIPPPLVSPTRPLTLPPAMIGTAVPPT